MSATIATEEAPTFGQHLRHRRLKLGLTQQQIADKLGVTKAQVGQWERDEALPSTPRLPRLARSLKVSAGRVGLWIEDSPLSDGVTQPLSYWPLDLHVRAA